MQHAVYLVLSVAAAVAVLSTFSYYAGVLNVNAPLDAAYALAYVRVKPINQTHFWLGVEPAYSELTVERVLINGTDYPVYARVSAVSWLNYSGRPVAVRCWDAVEVVTARGSARQSLSFVVQCPQARLTTVLDMGGVRELLYRYALSVLEYHAFRASTLLKVEVEETHNDGNFTYRVYLRNPSNYTLLIVPDIQNDGEVVPASANPYHAVRASGTFEPFLVLKPGERVELRRLEVQRYGAISGTTTGGDRVFIHTVALNQTHFFINGHVYVAENRRQTICIDAERHDISLACRATAEFVGSVGPFGLLLARNGTVGVGRIEIYRSTWVYYDVKWLREFRGYLNRSHYVSAYSAVAWPGERLASRLYVYPLFGVYMDGSLFGHVGVSPLRLYSLEARVLPDGRALLQWLGDAYIYAEPPPRAEKRISRLILEFPSRYECDSSGCRCVSPPPLRAGDAFSPHAEIYEVSFAGDFRGVGVLTGVVSYVYCGEVYVRDAVFRYFHPTPALPGTVWFVDYGRQYIGRGVYNNHTFALKNPVATVVYTEPLRGAPFAVLNVNRTSPSAEGSVRLDGREVRVRCALRQDFVEAYVHDGRRWVSAGSVCCSGFSQRVVNVAGMWLKVGVYRESNPYDSSQLYGFCAFMPLAGRPPEPADESAAGWLALQPGRGALLYFPAAGVSVVAYFDGRSVYISAFDGARRYFSASTSSYLSAPLYYVVSTRGAAVYELEYVSTVNCRPWWRHANVYECTRSLKAAVRPEGKGYTSAYYVVSDYYAMEPRTGQNPPDFEYSCTPDVRYIPTGLHTRHAATIDGRPAEEVRREYVVRESGCGVEREYKTQMTIHVAYIGNRAGTVYDRRDRRFCTAADSEPKDRNEIGCK